MHVQLLGGGSDAAHTSRPSHPHVLSVQRAAWPVGLGQLRPLRVRAFQNTIASLIFHVSLPCLSACASIAREPFRPPPHPHTHEWDAITAIPRGLLDFTTALFNLYGRPRPTMASSAHLHRHSGRPATLGYRIALNSPYALPALPACSDRLVSALCRDANRVCCCGPLCTTYIPLLLVATRRRAAVAWFCYPPRYTAGT